MEDEIYEQKRIGRDHELIGQYVVEVSDPLESNSAKALAWKLNQMVYEREGVFDRFKVVGKSPNCIVVRKLLGETDDRLGDLEEFINTDLLEL